jgi:uncharacterized protein with von Willebrand factor type A (vWA) domain
MNFNWGQLRFDIPSWDAICWSDYAKQSSAAQAILERGMAKNYSWPTFAGEVFHRLYNPAPSPLPPDQVRPESAWALKLHEQLDNTPSFITLQFHCRGDIVRSGGCTVTFLEILLQELPEPDPALQDPQPLRDQVRSQLQMAQQLELQMQGGTPEQSQQVQQQLQDIQKAVEALRQEGKQAVEAALAYAKQCDAPVVRTQLVKAAQGALEESKRIVLQLQALGWGTEPGGAPSRECGELKMALAKRLQQSQKLQDICKEAGRLQIQALAKQRSKTPEAQSELEGITQGDDLALVMASEFAALEYAPEQFFTALAEGTLSQYEVAGKEPQGRGPLVVCLDSSRSMKAPFLGVTAEVWSKAYALAMLTIARQQKRAFHVIHFTAQVKRQDDFPVERFDYMRLLDTLLPFFKGGTSWEAPLGAAAEAIEKYDHLKNADIVLITDDNCECSPGFIEQFKSRVRSLEATSYGIIIADASTGELGKVVDHAFSVTSFDDEQVANNVLFSV